MTGLARLKATGSGTLSARVEFEGLDVVFCTHAGMTGPEFDGSPNLLPAPGSVTWTGGGGGAATSGQADPDGGTAAWLLTDDGAAALERADSSTAAYVSGTPVRCVVKIKRESSPTAFPEVRVGFGGVFADDGVDLDLATGAARARQSTTLYSEIDVTEESGWWIVRFTHAGGSGSTVSLRVYPAIGATYPTVTGAPATGSVTVYAPSIVSSYGRERVGGLKLDGFKTTERAHLTKSTLEAKGATVKLADVGGKATLALAAEPEHTTWLTATCDADDTTITVASTAGWPDAGVLHIDTEAIAYTGKTSTTFTGCTRGIWRTVAQHHYVGTGGSLRYPEVTSRVTVLEGRRMRLHVYERGDSKRGDGTQRWLGVVSGSPRMTGPAWSIMCDSIARILDAELGVGLDQPIGPRGIYHNAASPWVLRIWRKIGDPNIQYYNDHNYYDWIASADDQVEVRIPSGNTSADDGFFESQDEFIAHAQPLIDAVTAGWATSIYIEPWGSSYRFRVYCGGGTPDGVLIRVLSRVDGGVEPGLHRSEDGLAPDPIPPAGRYEHTISAGVRYYTYLTGVHVGAYYEVQRFPGAGTVPRGIFGSVSAGDAYGPLAPGSPVYRIYLGGIAAAPPVGSSALIKWSDTDTEKTYEVRASGAGDRYIEINRGSSPDDPGWHRYNAAIPATIRIGRSYGASTTVGALGTWTLMDALEDEAPEQVNLGAQPMVQPDDWNSAEWLEAYAGANALATQRAYSTFEPIKLLDFIAADLQLASCFLAFDAQGRLTIKRLRLASQTEAGTFAIDRTNLAAWPTYERSPMGQINTVALVSGYDAREGEAIGQPYTVRNVGSYGRAPNAKILAIEPRSAYVGPPISPDDVMECAQTVLGIFSGPYAYVTCEVPLTALDVTLGSTVSITTHHLPDQAGRRAMSGQVGLVIAREIDWYGAKIELTVLVDARRIAGYAPSALITSYELTGDDEYDLTLDVRTLADGESWADHFQPGEAIVLEEFDASSPTTVTGTVGGASSSTAISVTLDSAWTPGSAKWLVRAGNAGDATERQARYAYVAGSDLVIDFSDAQPARQFAP